MPSARTPRRNGPYAPLSAFYADDDAVIALEEAGDDLAELVFLRGLAHCAREPKLNGYISLAKLRTGRIIRRPAPKLMKAASHLVEVGLWTPDGDGGWRIKRWEKWNSTHEEIVERQARDAARKAGQNGAESARIPVGVQADSAPYVSTRHFTSGQGTSRQGSGSTCDPPLPPLLDELQQRLAQAGIAVPFDVDQDGLVGISEAIDRCGIPALVKYAKSRHQPNQPAFSVKAYLAGWRTLPARRLEAVGDPCPHGAPHWTRCQTCRAEAEAS